MEAPRSGSLRAVPLGRRGSGVRSVACRVAILLAATVSVAGPSLADDPGSVASGVPPGPHATVEWLIEAPLVPGTFTRTAVIFRIDDGWHTYGNTQNDTGFPARFQPVLPPGVEVISEAWPTPERHVSPGNILDHVYKDETAVFLDLFVSPGTPPGQTELGLQVDWLVCREACIFEGDSLVVTATVSSPMALIPAPGSERTAPYLARLPKPLPAGSGVQVESIANTEALPEDVVRITVQGAERLTFIPALDGASLTHGIEDGTATGGRLELRIEPGSGDLAGTLEVQRSGKIEYFRIP